MSSNLQQNFRKPSLSKRQSARSVLLRMAADQARAERIRQIKEDNPQLTWTAIADFVGISERAAKGWAETGSIAYTNAKKLAELIDDIDVDWIMRGPRPEAPDLAATLDGGRGDLEDRLARIEEQQSAVLNKLEELLSLEKKASPPLQMPKPRSATTNEEQDQGTQPGAG